MRFKRIRIWISRIRVLNFNYGMNRIYPNALESYKKKEGKKKRGKGRAAASLLASAMRKKNLGEESPASGWRHGSSRKGWPKRKKKEPLANTGDRGSIRKVGPNLSTNQRKKNYINNNRF